MKASSTIPPSAGINPPHHDAGQRPIQRKVFFRRSIGNNASDVPRRSAGKAIDLARKAKRLSDVRCEKPDNRLFNG